MGLLETNAFAEEKDPKPGSVSPSGLSSIKIIFALLTKLVIVYL